MQSIARSKRPAPTLPIRAPRSIGSTSPTKPAPATYDAIVCNPPFHAGRAAEPALGQGIIAAAARALRPGGRFYMVANRGLPYEPLLKASFASFETLADNNKFRISRAIR